VFQSRYMSSSKDTWLSKLQRQTNPKNTSQLFSRYTFRIHNSESYSKIYHHYLYLKLIAKSNVKSTLISFTSKAKARKGQIKQNTLLSFESHTYFPWSQLPKDHIKSSFCYETEKILGCHFKRGYWKENRVPFTHLLPQSPQ